MAENIIIDGLSCDNCPEFKRCQEQQNKKEYAINQVLQDIPSEYANIIDRLKQIIPSITRCDYVLEKQLKRKEKTEARLVKQIQIICDFINNRSEIFKGIYGGVDKIITEYAERKEKECEELKKYLHQNFKEKDKLHLIIDRLLEASGYDTNTASAEDFEDVYENMRYEKQQLDQLKTELEQEKALKETYLTCYKAKHEDIDGELFKFKQTLAEIKKIAEQISLPMGTGKSSNRVILANKILQKISECEVENDT